MEIKKKKKLNRVQMIRTNAATPLKSVSNNPSKVATVKQIENTSNIPSISTKKSTVYKKSKAKIKPGKPATKLFGDKLPTVAQLLGLTMNDFDTTPASYIESAAVSANETSTVAGSTLINTNAPLPPGFIVIQGNSGVQQTSLNSTSVMNHHQAQPCIVMPTNPQMITAKKATKTSTVSQQIPLVLSNSTSNSGGANKVKQNNPVAVTKSHLLTAPVMASGIQTCPPPTVLTNHSTGLAGLGPGTLILANGNIVPVLPPPQTVLTATPTQFIVNSNQLPPPANPPPVIMMQQKKNAITRTTSSNVAALVTPSCSKPQQRSFPVLAPKVSKQPGTSDTTVTTFANKVPIPALTSRHQPARCQQIQAPVINTVTRSTGKAKSKGDNENINQTNTDLPVSVSDKVQSTATKKTVTCKAKEKTKIVSANDNSQQRSPSNSSEVSITDVTVDSSGTKEGDSMHEDTEVSGEVSERVDKDMESNGTTAFISDATSDGERNCKQDEHSMLNNQETQTEKRNIAEEARPGAVKRKKECEDACSKKKQTKCGMENHESRNADMETNISVTNALDNTLPPNMHALKSCNTGTYTIDVLCMTEPGKCHNIDRISEESKHKENSSTLMDTVCSEAVTKVSAQSIKDCSRIEDDAVQLTTNETREISEVCGLNIQAVSRDNSKPVSRSESELIINDPSLINTCPASDTHQCDDASDRTDKCNTSTVLYSVPQQGYDTQNAVTKSQLLQATEVNKLPQSSQSVTAADVAYPRTDFQLSEAEPQQNNLIKASGDSVSLQNAHNIQHEGREMSPQKSTELLNSSSWQKGKESVLTNSNSTRCPSIPVCQASHTVLPVSASVLQQQQHVINTAGAKEHDLCTESSACLSLTHQEKKTVTDQTEPSQMPPLQSSNLYPTFSATAMATQCNENTFIPITSTSADVDTGSKTTDNETNVNSALNISLQNSEFSSDLFASLQVPSSGQHPESVSPTAAFLLAFPLVSSSKVTEMMVDPQEEVGSDGMQGASTLLQIGNIEPDPSHNTSKPHHTAIVNEMAGTSETTATKVTTVSSVSIMSDRDNTKITSGGCNEHNQQQEVSCSNQERKMNPNQEPKTSGKHSTNVTLPLEIFSNSSNDKQWPNTTKGEVIEPDSRPHPRSRSIGTQSNLFSDLEMKSSEATCSQNSLSSTIKTCLAIDTSMYNIPPNGQKGNTSTPCFQQEIETGHTAVSKNNTSQHLTLNCQSHITMSKSGQQHQECHSSSGLFQPPLSTFEPVTHKNMSNEDNTKKLAVSTSTFSTSVSQPIEELCMKPQVSVNLQHSGTCVNTNVTQTFLTNKETHHVCAQLSHAQIPGSTATDHTANQNSFHKMHPSQMISKQSTVTEESTENVGSISYKSLTSSSSIASSVDVIKHNFSNHAVMDSVPHSSHMDRSVPYNHVPSSVPAQSYSYNLFSNDYSPLPSQVTSTASYTQASNSNDHNKTSAAFSFSVAHNSSNFSILSWTTLSPMSAPTNSNQYDNFNVPSQNTSTDMPHHTPTTGASLHKPVSQNTSDNHAITMSIPAASEMRGLIHTNNCQKQCKSDTNIGKSMNEEIHKLTGSFQGLYSNEEQQSLGISDRDTSRSHMQFHPANNENQVTVPHEGSASSESFKFPPPSSADVKSQQSARTNHSSVRMKASQQNHRPPVNWMTTPDIRTSSSSCSATCNVPNTMSAVNSETNSPHMNKEFEFCSTSNHNLFMSNASVTPPTFDGRGFAGNAAIYGNHVLPSHSNLYTSNRQSSHLPYHKEESRNLHHNATHQRLADLPAPGQNYHNETYTLPWTPRKVPFTSATMMPPDVSSNNFVPSTLPTLVGDLALGANYPMSGNEDSTHNKPYVHSNFGEGEINKKNASVGTLEDQQEMSGKHIQSRHAEKESGMGVVSNKARNNSSNNRACTQDYPGTAHSERGSSGATAAVSGNFLSVSQLVDHVKSGAGSSRTQVNTTARRSTNGNRHVGGGNKNNTTQSRQHTATSSSSKRNSTTQNSTERDSSKKQQATNMSFSAGEGTSAMPLTGDINRKVNDGDRNSHYSTENTTALMPPISQSSAGFAVPVHDMGSHPSSSVANRHSHWSPTRGKPGRTSSASYKAPVSSYSAEALIGLSSSSSSNSTLNNANTAHLSQESTTNKVMTLPPPMVSERFCHNQNYHPHPQTARPLQMSASFGNEAIIPGNYFPAVDLPPSHHQDGNGSSIQTSSHHDNFTQTPHQNQQPYSNASFSYPAGPTNMSGQAASTLYPPTNFVSNANGGHPNASIPPVSLPTGFLSDLAGSNNFPGIPSDSNNSLIFPSPIMKSITVNRNNGGRHNPSYLESSTSASSHHHNQSGQHLSTRNDSLSGQAVETNRSGNNNITSNDGNGNRRLSGHAGGLPPHHQTNNLGGNGNSNCSLTKQRGNGSRRRIPDPIPSASSSTSGITGLVDLGYLPMPPGIGSPMLGADDSTFLSHHTSGTFLAPPGPQLYPTGPTPNPQGTLYPPAPRPPTQTTSHTNQHSGGHLPPFSSCAPEQQNASLSRASHHQQQQQANTSPNATNTSGNSLANFNLSTIFPEINDKVS